MATKRKQYTAAFKAQMALAALKGDKTINERASLFGVHPTLIPDWPSVVVPPPPATGFGSESRLFARMDSILARNGNMLYAVGGVEVAVLDCVGCLRHFLHLFHRLSTKFLDEDQELVLSQPESGVNQALKEAFLALRRAAQAAE